MVSEPKYTHFSNTRIDILQQLIAIAAAPRHCSSSKRICITKQLGLVIV
jgi:hypothetical protein